MRSLLLSLLTATALCACDAGSADEPTVPEASTPPAEEVAPVSPEAPAPPDEPPGIANSEDADDDPCGADKLGRWLNVLPTETVKAEIAQTVGERAIRYYTQGDPVTMDFHPDRLNVEFGVDGRIKVFRCG